MLRAVMSAIAVPVASSPNRTRLFVALGLVYVIWSSTYYGLRLVVESLPPFMSGGLRYALAGAILLGIQRFRGKPWPTRAEWLRALPVGVLLFAVGNGLVGSAEQSIGSGVAAVVCGTTPLWAGVLGPAFGERASAREWLGMAVGFAGVVVLGFGGDLRAEPLAAFLVLLAPVGWALGSLFARRLKLAPGGTGAATQLITGGAFMLMAGPIVGERLPDHVGSEAIFALVYLVVFGSLVAFSAYHYVLTNARPAVAMSYAYVNPVLALVLGATLGAEHVGVEVVIGTAMIAGSVLLLVRKRSGSITAPRAFDRR